MRALTNVRKHAQAHRVSISIFKNRSGSSVTLTIADDGVGMGEPHRGGPGGYGLVSMRERAESAGGWLALVSPPGGGLSVVVELPAGERSSMAV